MQELVLRDKVVGVPRAVSSTIGVQACAIECSDFVLAQQMRKAVADTWLAVLHGAAPMPLRSGTDWDLGCKSLEHLFSSDMGIAKT